MIKRIIILFAAVFMAVGTLFAQSESTGWKENVTGLDSLIKSNPSQAFERVEQLLKGKNKKNRELIVSIGRSYLDAGKVSEADTYQQMAQKIDNKKADVYLLAGDIALAKREIGPACQAYEQAIYFEPQCAEAYFQYARVYKMPNPQLAIEKLKELKNIYPDDLAIDKELADIYYVHNRLKEAIGEYALFIASPVATETDMVKYAFALFLNHEFDKSLEIVNRGLQQNPNQVTFNRLAMYNEVDLKQYAEAEKAATQFFSECKEADYCSLDYRYYGTLLQHLGQTEKAVEQYQKALSLEPENADLWASISEVYEQGGLYGKAVNAYLNYSHSLSPEKQTPDIDFHLGKLYYAEGTSSDSLLVNAEQRHEALLKADSVFAVISQKAPDSYIGNFWRARTNSVLDPETTQGLAKPYYEAVAASLQTKEEARYHPVLIECYSYLGYYYLVAEKYQESKDYWNKILTIDPSHVTAKKALEGIK